MHSSYIQGSPFTVHFTMTANYSDGRPFHSTPQTAQLCSEWVLRRYLQWSLHYLIKGPCCRVSTSPHAYKLMFKFQLLKHCLNIRLLVCARLYSVLYPMNHSEIMFLLLMLSSFWGHEVLQTAYRYSRTGGNNSILLKVNVSLGQQQPHIIFTLSIPTAKSIGSGGWRPGGLAL